MRIDGHSLTRTSPVPPYIVLSGKIFKFLDDIGAVSVKGEIVVAYNTRTAQFSKVTGGCISISGELQFEDGSRSQRGLL